MGQTLARLPYVTQNATKWDQTPALSFLYHLKDNIQMYDFHLAADETVNIWNYMDFFRH